MVMVVCIIKDWFFKIQLRMKYQSTFYQFDWFPKLGTYQGFDINRHGGFSIQDLQYNVCIFGLIYKKKFGFISKN